MKPLRYKGIVVGMKQYVNEIDKEIERVRRLGLQNRKNVANPEKSSRPGVWYDHCDPGVNPYEVSFVFFMRNQQRRYLTLLFKTVSLRGELEGQAPGEV